jgi:hypothetical protein
MENYSLYKPIKEKSNVIGFWLDNGKIYKDRIKMVKYSAKEKNNLLKNEVCIFYSNDNHAICEYKNKQKIIFYNRYLGYYKKINKKLILNLLYLYKGITIYKTQNKLKFIVEIWQ